MKRELRVLDSLKRANLWLSMLLAGMLTFAVSCSDDDPITPPDSPKPEQNDPKPEPDPKPEQVVPTEGVSIQAFYKGDLYETGKSGNLWINFISDMAFDSMGEDYVGPGYILCLDFNTTLAKNADFATLAEGVYTCDYKADTHKEFTLNVANGDSFLKRYPEKGAAQQLDITGGTVEVSIKEGYYVIKANLTLKDESTYQYEYIGKIAFLNRSTEGFMSNLTQDVEIKDLSQGMLIHCGEVFTPTSHLYNVVLAGPDYDLAVNYGNSDALMLSVNVTPGSSTAIPSGTYTIINAETADDYPVNTALSGVYNPVYGGYFGSWYFSTLNSLESSIRKGTITITHEGGNKYTFDVKLEDGYGHKVTATFCGECRFENWA